MIGISCNGTARKRRNLRLGLFGGSFDPVHLGHLEIARSAKELFDLDEVHFILANASPFKFQDKLKDHEKAKAGVRQECQRAEILKLALEDYQGTVVENAENEDCGQSQEETAAQRAVSRLRRANDRSVLGVHEDHEDDENAGNGVVRRSQELNFKLNLMELNREPPSYTYQTVEEFKELYPRAELFWIMGSDSFSELPKWKKVAYLIENLEFIVFRRKATGLKTDNLLETELFSRAEFIDLKKKLKVNFIENPYIDVSSTLIRKSLLNPNDLNVLDGKLSNHSKGLIIEYYRKRFRE
jgi:cytidyltransferase-like protein